ncbi:MAG: glycoside hydrolase family 2 TIM barrel-domain containing protein, partial [Planctomycetota bacterium]
MRGPLFISMILALACVAATAEEKWQPAPSPLVTRFAEKVSPKEIPLYEFYPRPLLTRHHDGRNLAGLWDYAVTDAAVTQPPVEYQGKIMAPFPIESALSGVKRSVAPNEKLWYRISCELPWGTDWLKGQNSRLMLRFGGVSGTAAVFANGKAVGTHEGSNDGFSFDVTDVVTEKGKHTMEIVVAATPGSAGVPPARAGETPALPGPTGIYKPAWIEAVRTSHIESLKFVPDVDGSSVRVTPSGPATEQDSVEVIAYDRSFEVARAGGKMGEELTLKIENLRPWRPDRPFTYEYRATVTRGKQLLDSVFSLFAVRKVSLGKGENDATVVLLNNKPVFLTGVLDAGWWPDGGSTAPYIEAIRRDIEKMKQFGFNTVRKALHTDQEQWYFWADRLGVLVLQELPAGDTPQLLQEYPRIITELFNHPAIIAWVLPAGLNADAAKQLTDTIRKSDPTRLVVGGPNGDIREIRTADVEKAGTSKQATILSPIGDAHEPVRGHEWTPNTAEAPGQIASAYNALAGMMADYAMRADLSGFIYKQFADAGDDYSGLVSSDREAIKLDLGSLVARFNEPWKRVAIPRLTMIVPSGLAGGSEWQYTATQPKGDWQKPSFDASAWSKGKTAFGPVRTGPGLPDDSSPISTAWNGPDIWMRHEFTLDTARLYDPWIALPHAGDATVFLNGNPVAERRGASHNVELLRCGNGVVGRNVIAVHGHAEPGKGQLDVGLFDLLPQRDMRLPEGIKPIIDTWMRDTCVMLGPDGIYYLVGTGTTAPWK